METLSHVSLKQHMIQWNNTFPLDRWYRQKHGIAYFSEAHLKVCQIDVYLEYLEDLAFKEFESEMEQIEVDKKQLAKGQYFRERRISNEQAMKAFADLDLSLFNNADSQIRVDE